MIALFAALALQTASVPCALTEADRLANRELSFGQFDQGMSDLPHTGWNLSQAGCYAEAIAAEQDYLVFGPKLERRETLAVAWHMALNVANMGDEPQAARMVSTAINDARTPEDGFEWNTYVRGVWAFLTKDHALLDRSAAALATGPGQRNAINARALRRLSKCFDRPYAEAVHSEACAVE